MTRTGYGLPVTAGKNRETTARTGFKLLIDKG
nr:MAG TPA: hypothetical protein [Caudoviricetes sp.]